MVYQYGLVDMPHLYPVRSPSGKLLTIRKTEPYPHHRSVWFGDAVQLAGQPKSSFYAPLYSQVDKNDPQSPYRDRIRQVKFLTTEVKDGQANLEMQLCWEAKLGEVPVIDEVRRIRVVALGRGEYFLDCRFTVTAAYGEVTFRSDQAHYAWPYVRMHPPFAVERMQIEKGPGDKARDKTVKEKGTGTITNSEGQVRPDAQSGKPFVLKKGDSLSQRVGLLIHSGDVKSGRVAERYEQYAAGRL